MKIAWKSDSMCVMLFKLLQQKCPKIGVQEVLKKGSTPSSTLGEWNIFGCARLKHKWFYLNDTPLKELKDEDVRRP